MRRHRTTILMLVAALGLAGCRGMTSEDPPIHPNPNMDDQHVYDPQEASGFFADGLAQRMPVAGTVARGELNLDVVFHEGKNEDGTFVARSPVMTTRELLERGQERYNIYCSVCHDRVGSGKGIVMTAYQGMVPPPSFHDERILEMPDGELYSAIANGVRTMPSYASQIQSERDRWAIVAYIRALQRSQNASREDVPEDILETLN